jgi:probable rRNA maturation factor
VKRNPLGLTVQYATEKPWVPSRRQLARWASAALPARTHHDLTVRIVGGGESRSLNRRYRHQDKPTNVLSFPSTLASVEGRRPLGDLVVCAPVVSREARDQDKAREAHWAHMIVHGTLHLLGYDHERTRDAQRMERREVRILSGLGVPNPYISRERKGRAVNQVPSRGKP